MKRIKSDSVNTDDLENDER